MANLIIARCIGIQLLCPGIDRIFNTEKLPPECIFGGKSSATLSLFFQITITIITCLEGYLLSQYSQGHNCLPGK